MNLVFLAPHFKTGGGNRVFIELANELAKMGHLVDFVFANNSDKSNTFSLDVKVGISKIGRYRNNKFQKIINLIKLFIFVKRRKNKAKIIVSDPIMSILIPLLGKLQIYRYVQGDDFGLFDDRSLVSNKLFLRVLKFLIKLSFRYKVSYLFNSKFSYDNFIQHSDRSDVECRIVHPAINHEIFYNKNIRQKDPISLCLVGRKHLFKGLDDFIQVWKANKSSLSDRIKEIFIISDDDLSKYDLSDFKLISPENDLEIAQVYNKCGIFIFTSWREGFGLPALEAMACGCAVILTDCGGVREYASEGENCLMYHPKDRKRLKECLDLLLDSEELINRIGLSGQFASADFSWDNSARKLLSVMEFKNE